MPIDHSKNIIEVKNISFAYGAENVLENITLDIHQGDYIGIVGPNGAGKTTLFKIMLGLLRPRTGSVKLFGQEIDKFKDWRKIGYVPQKVANFEANFPATVFEVVAMGLITKLKLFNRELAEEQRAVKEALEQVEMWPDRYRLIGDLSGGQIQRVFIARALVNRPEVVFLDEPTAGVDQRTQESFYQMLRQLNQVCGITLALVSHDIGRLTKEVMHIACVDRHLTCHLSPEEFIRASQSSDISGEKVKIITHHHHY